MDLDKWENKKKNPEDLFNKIKGLVVCLEYFGFSYISILKFTSPVLTWLVHWNWLSKADKTRCWPVSSRWQHEASLLLLFYRTLDISVMVWSCSSQDSFLWHIFSSECAPFFFYGIFKCFISSEVERQFCFIVLATYFSFQLFCSRSHLKSFMFSKTFILIQAINYILCRTRVIPAALHEKCSYWVTLQSCCEIFYSYTQFTTYFTSILH